jgi:hypothetical protein
MARSAHRQKIVQFMGLWIICIPLSNVMHMQPITATAVPAAVAVTFKSSFPITLPLS